MTNMSMPIFIGLNPAKVVLPRRCITSISVQVSFCISQNSRTAVPLSAESRGDVFSESRALRLTEQLANGLPHRQVRYYLCHMGSSANPTVPEKAPKS